MHHQSLARVCPDATIDINYMSMHVLCYVSCGLVEILKSRHSKLDLDIFLFLRINKDI